MNENTSQFEIAVQCPECGEDTYELYHARFTKYGEEVLMCDACYEIELKD